MKKITIIIYAATLICCLASCKKQLEVRNPNQPTPESATTELGIISLAQGSIYRNGFVSLKYSDGIYGFFWSGAIGFHEMMGDAIQAEAANGFINQIGAPDKVTLDNGSVILNPNAPNTQHGLLKLINTNANQGANTLFYEWAYMYSLINGANSVAEIAEKATFASDAEVKKATLKAWSLYWKGFAYSRIGSMYYAGLINDVSGETSNNYVTKEAIIAESNKNLDAAAAVLSAISNVAAYTDMLGKIIPSFNQVGKGGLLTPDMWKRNINTLKARNILVNTPAAAMTPAQWSTILTLTNDGIRATDKVFTGRSNATGDFLSASSGTVASKVQATSAGGNTYKLSERLVQEFKSGDKRFTNNIKLTTTWIGNSDRGHVFNTRYTLVNGGAGLAGVIVYANTAPGGEELFLSGNYEENELMKGEALINTANIEDGLKAIDVVRTYQGAGLPAVAGTGLSLAQAKEELRRERRVAFPFIGLSFYDARRYGIINAISAGGGRKGAVVVSGAGVVSTNATIEYNYIDYWDVPDNELAYNPPGDGSAPVKNPKL
jgi:starch-binding outer membrane protein, SusD/RagB family